MIRHLTRARLGGAAALACAIVAAVSAQAQKAAEPKPAAPPAAKLPAPAIPETHAIPQKTVSVLGETMAYLELGEGEAVLFLHGNPTSSYLWRNVVPHVASGPHGQRRAIAVDLIGMGASSKPAIGYGFEDHYRYLAAFIDALKLEQVTLVGHDWGAALGWAYAARNPDRVKALAFMEGVLPPGFPVPSFEAMGPEMGGMFRAFKDPVQGERMVLDENMFVEQVLPGFVNRPLGPTAMAAYRAPFATRESRRPALAWPRAVPIAGEPAETVAAMAEIAACMASTEMPVLLVYAAPGVVTPPAAVPWYLKTIKTVRTAFVGQGLHFIQEDQPDAIGRALSEWIRTAAPSN